MTSSRKPKRKGESYTTGDKGRNRVRLFADPRRDSRLFLEYRDEAGRKKSLSLGHDDFTQGKVKANELAAALLKHEGPNSDVLTLKTLFDNYEREVTPTKGVSAQSHDRRARKLFEMCWGSRAVMKNLDRRDWDRFISQRRSGALRPSGRSGKTKEKREAGVRNRIIEQDLKFLIAVCHWAETVRVKGQPMLDRNPFRGFPIPVEANPNRPLTTGAEFQRLTEAATGLGQDVSLYLLLTHETGHRCTAVGRLRWSDVDLDKGLVVWRAAHDKMGIEHTVPLSERATEALRSARRHAARIGDGWVFPSPSSPDQPIRRDLLRDWWQRLETAAKLERVKGRGWHSLRRKFATDLKHDTPLADLCSLGGWKDYNTVLKCYMRPDEVTMRGALARRSERRAASE
jgi:integrase